MDLTLVGRALRRNKIVTALGLLVALVAGLFAGYSVSGSGLEPRTPAVYTGSSTLFLSNPSLSVYAAQLGGTTQADPTAIPENANLANLAMLYAWVVTGDEVRVRTEAVVGDLEEGESLTAVRRTTQPEGDERFGSNAQLPIFDIVASAATEERAEEITTAATGVFLDYVVQQQEQAGIAPEQRVGLSVLREARAELVDGGNSPLSAALVASVVAFVVLLLVVYRTNAAEVRAARAGSPGRARHVAPPAAGAVNHEPTDPREDRWEDDREPALARSAQE